MPAPVAVILNDVPGPAHCVTLVGLDVTVGKAVTPNTAAVDVAAGEQTLEVTTQRYW
jgi:hypothetical protein